MKSAVQFVQALRVPPTKLMMFGGARGVRKRHNEDEIEEGREAGSFVELLLRLILKSVFLPHH